MKLLRLLESNRSGERAAAAKKATELMRKHKLDWDKLIGGGIQNARGSSFVDFNSGSQDFLNGFKRGKDTGYAEGYNAGYVQGVAAAQAEAAKIGRASCRERGSGSGAAGTTRRT